MWKKLISLALLTPLLAGMFLTSCGKYDKNGILKKRPDIGELDLETEEQLKEDIWNWFYTEEERERLELNFQEGSLTKESLIDSIFRNYLGTYNGYVVVYLEKTSISAVFCEYEEVIENLIFYYSASNYSLILRIYAWKPGNFYTLTEAYEKKFLTKKMLQKIHDIYVYDMNQKTEDNEK